jgi:hypothetical protein
MGIRCNDGTLTCTCLKNDNTWILKDPSSSSIENESNKMIAYNMICPKCGASVVVYIILEEE